MTLRSKINAIERRVPWGVIGFIVGLVGLAFALHFGLRHPTARFALEVSNEVNVLDVRQPLSDLKIAFRGEDIQRSNLNLRVLVAKLENVGEVDILQNHYDRDDVWGIRVTDGKLIEARLIDTNSEYVRRQLDPRVNGDSLVHLTKVIFEHGKHFTLELLVLHAKDKTPSLQMVGKIAGIDATPTIRAWLERQRGSIWRDAFTGRFTVQLVRIGVYFIGTLLVIVALVLVALLVENITDRLRKRRRRKKIETYLDTNKSELDKALGDVFVKNGLIGLSALAEALSGDRTGIQRMVEAEARHAGKAKETDSFSAEDHRRMMEARERDMALWEAVRALTASGVLKLDDDAHGVIPAELATKIQQLTSQVSENTDRRPT